MTVEKFLQTLKLIVEVNQEAKLKSSLQAVSEQLSNIVGSPAAPNFQSALAASLENLNATADVLSDSFSTSEFEAVVEVGGGDFFDASIATEISETVSKNAMTPSVARDFVRDLSSRYTEFLGTVETTIDGLEQLGVSEEVLQPGTASISFLIPRDIFSNRLESFSVELRFMDRLIKDLSEAVTGKVEPVLVDTLSSSVPTIALLASAPVLLVAAKAVSAFLDAWEKVERIRKLRAETSELGIRGKALEAFDDQITKTVDKVVEESTTLCFSTYKGDTGRRNELETAVEQDLRRLYGQIERGLVVQFRSAVDETASAAAQKTLEAVSSIGKVLVFPDPEPEPLLLASGEVLEGELKVTKKKVTTTKTITKTGVEQSKRK